MCPWSSRFEKHTLPSLPPVFQAFKEYKERSSLNPTLGNLLGCFWDSCTSKERAFWTAALQEHAQYHDTDDGKVYHAIKFGQDYPDYKPKDNELPDDRPQDNDKRFSYYTDVMRWDTCRVIEERTIQNASDKTKSWMVYPDMLVSFPLSQEESNRVVAMEKQPGKGAKGDRPQYLLIQTLQGQNNPRRMLMQYRLKGKIQMLHSGKDDLVPCPRVNLLPSLTTSWKR